MSFDGIGQNLHGINDFWTKLSSCKSDLLAAKNKAGADAVTIAIANELAKRKDKEIHDLKLANKTHLAHIKMLQEQVAYEAKHPTFWK